MPAGAAPQFPGPDPSGTDAGRVSVLMPTYNQEDYVGAAIASVLAQDAAPFEFIIADDCSTDGTWERVGAATAGYAGPHRLRLVRNERNLGVNGNLNRMIALAGGEILIAAAGDDLSSPDRVRRVAEIFRSEKPLLVHSGFRPLMAEGQSYDGRFDDLILTRTTSPVDIAGSTALFVGATAAWHRDLFRIFGPLPDGVIYEDLILGYRAALAGRIARIDAPLVDYRIGVGISAQGPSGRANADWTAFRLATLLRHKATFLQRRADALAFGLKGGSEVLCAIDHHLAATAMRMDAISHPTGDYLRRHWRHPLLALRCLRSERRRARQAARA